MRILAAAMVLTAFANSLAYAASTFKPARPPAVPLAVRSPYLNAWLQGDDGTVLPGSWPRLWTGRILGWQGFVAVDGQVYNWMGEAPGPAPVNQVSVEYTSTKSIFTFDVNGKVTMTVTFLSPVYADDLSRQSQQFSYISVKASSSDGSSHSVQVYMDVTGEWASGDLSQVLNWDFGTSGDASFLTFQRANQVEFSEDAETASWGTWYLTTATAANLTWKIGADVDVRGQFTNNKTLDKTKDSNFRAVNDNWPVFAFANDLGIVSQDDAEVIFSLGLVQDRVISFAGSTPGMSLLPGLWSSFYTDDISAVVAFFDDFENASTHADKLDERIQSDSEKAAGQDYATITTLAVRQTFGALQFAGTSEKPYIFLKEISSNSDIQTVDVIFPAFPIFLYLNATMGRLLLDPLFENQESGRYPNTYAEHDLGTFPVAKGYPSGNDEEMPVEEAGNMIVMTLSYAQATGDTAYLSAHFPKLAQWAEYLRNDSLIPTNQLSTDDFAGTLANQTNLALKGIIGLRAMSEIANLTGNEDTYGATAQDYLLKWKGLGINTGANPPHTTLSYGDNNSHGLLYNLYADKLLGLNFVDQSIYDMQSNFYPTVALDFGVPLDTRHTWTKGDWEMYVAAIASQETRDMFISKLATWIGKTDTDRAFSDLYDAGTGTFPVGGPTFVARPVMGGSFALLALPKSN